MPVGMLNMKILSSSAIAVGAFAGAMLIAASAQADVFSDQNFSGESASLNALPGVNLDAAPGFSGASNCVETGTASFRTRTGRETATVTECKVGNFTFSTIGETPSPHYDTTYGGNPPPWAEGWRPE